MPAIMEQTSVEQVLLPGVDQVTLPNASYDLGSQAITATVVVSRSESDGLSFQTPPLVLKGPQVGESSPAPWTVMWQFAPDASLDGFLDADYEIQIPAQNTSAVPQEVTATRIEPRLWQFTLTRPVSLSMFSYDIVEVASGVAQVVHDPSIAVTPDPIGN